MLSVFRILLIPVFVWLYCFEDNYPVSTLVLVLSGVTDMVDGYIARHFNMISNFGKALDPIADKLTQLAILICLGLRFPWMFLLAAFLAIKELTTGIIALIVVKKTRVVKGSDWHGKVSTLLLYTMMGLHVIWYDIPQDLSYALIIICLCMVALSFVLYTIRHVAALKANKTKK